MKREKEINKKENKISTLFSNNKNLENTTMKVEITKTYKIGETTFSTIQEANIHILKELYNQGLEEILKNPDTFVQALKAATNQNSNPERNLGGTGNMREIQQILEKQQYLISRHHSQWPVYIVVTPEKEQKIFRFTGKVRELHQLVLTIGIEEIISKYSYKL